MSASANQALIYDQKEMISQLDDLKKVMTELLDSGVTFTGYYYTDSIPEILVDFDNALRCFLVGFNITKVPFDETESHTMYRNTIELYGTRVMFTSIEFKAKSKGVSHV